MKILALPMNKNDEVERMARDWNINTKSDIDIYFNHKANLWSKFTGAMEYAKSKEYDLVFANHFVMGAIGARIKSRLKCKLVTHVIDDLLNLRLCRQPDLSMLKRFAIRKIQEYGTKRSNLVIAKYDGIASWAKDNGASWTKTIPYGTDLELYNPNKRSQNVKLKIAPNNQTIVTYAGGNDRHHGLETLLRAAHWIFKNRNENNFKFLILAPTHKYMFKKFAHRLIEFSYATSKLELATLLASSDILINPPNPQYPRVSAHNNKIMYYCASGVPIITSDIGTDYVKYCRDEHIGNYYKAGDHQDLAKTILDFGSMDKDISDVGRNARNLARELFDWKKNTMEIYNTIKAVVE